MRERTASIYQLADGCLQVSSPQLVGDQANELGKIHFQENGSTIVVDDNNSSVLCALLSELPRILGSNFEVVYR